MEALNPTASRERLSPGKSPPTGPHPAHPGGEARPHRTAAPGEPLNAGPGRSPAEYGWVSPPGTFLPAVRT